MPLNLSFQLSPGDSSMSLDNVYITFAASMADLVFGPNGENVSIVFNNGLYKNKYYTSKAFRLKEIVNSGMIINSATSLIAYISYGSANGIELQESGPAYTNPSLNIPRFSNFELTYSSGSGTADLTNISQFGGSLKLAFLSGGTVQEWVGNTLATTQMFNLLATASNNSPNAVYLKNKQFVRIIGTNVFPIGTATPNPYPTFNAYLQWLYDNYSNNAVKELTNLAPNHPPGGEGAAGYQSSSNATKVDSGIVYNLDYHFTAVIQATTPPPPNTPNGTYNVLLSGYVNATIANPAQGSIKNYTYSNLSINIPADILTSGSVDQYMTNLIYQGAVTGTGISITANGWSDLTNDFGWNDDYANACLLKAVGDFAEGMNCGFFGSTVVPIATVGTAFKDMTSYEWWQYPDWPYQNAQPQNSYYNPYGNVVYQNSAGYINGNEFNVGGVYGSPYDDRFKRNTINADSNTDELLITVLPDGTLTPNG